MCVTRGDHRLPPDSGHAATPLGGLSHSLCLAPIGRELNETRPGLSRSETAAAARGKEGCAGGIGGQVVKEAEGGSKPHGGLYALERNQSSSCGATAAEQRHEGHGVPHAPVGDKLLQSEIREGRPPS